MHACPIVALLGVLMRQLPIAFASHHSACRERLRPEGGSVFAVDSKNACKSNAQLLTLLPTSSKAP